MLDDGFLLRRKACRKLMLYWKSTCNHDIEGKTNHHGWILYSVNAELGVCCIRSVETRSIPYSAYAVLGECRTWCMPYSVYAVLGVCSTRCTL